MLRAADKALIECEARLSAWAALVRAEYARLADGVSVSLDVQPGPSTLTQPDAPAGSDRFGAMLLHWTVAKRRCEEAKVRCEAFRRHGLESAMAPRGEAARLAELADACASEGLAVEARAPGPLAVGLAKEAVGLVEYAKEDHAPT